MPYNDNQVPKRTGLLELLRQSIGSQFVIPVYQRNYTWTTGREVKQFLADLNNVLVGGCDKHFLGIMIYLDTTIDYSSREFSVIDGQQRLTTTFLTLYAIKELMLQQGMEAEVNKLNAQYFLANPWDTEKVKFKLKPQVSDDGVYQQIVNGEFNKVTEKDSNVYKNFIYIKDFISSLLGRFSLNDILLSMDKLYIVCVPVSVDDYPQKIFESINATGAKLTASDLIRNFVLMPIESDSQEKYYNKYWKKLETMLTGDSKRLESFFRIFLAAKNRSLPNKNAVYSVFVEWFEKNKDAYGVEGIFKEIVKYAEFYFAIYRQNITEVEPELRTTIKEFRKILSDLPAPLFIELYNLYKSTSVNGETLISAAQFTEIIDLTNTYLLRRALCGLDTSDITRLFPSLLKDVLNETKKDYSDIVNIYKKNLVNKNKGNSMEMPDDVKLYDSVLNANMYNIRTTLRIFFDKLELHENPAPVDLSKVSIEHLMPQSPTEEWYSTLGVTEEVYQRNLHRLGNLTLAAKSDNSKMGNEVWSYKNDILSSTSHLKMNEELLQKQQWTIEEIDNRTKDLIKKIQELYPYFELSGEYVIKTPIFLESNGYTASGYFYEDTGSVEIASGSMLNMNFENADNYPETEDVRRELLEEKIITETDNGVCFVKNYIINPKMANSTALSAAANLILHGSRNGWEYWKTEDNEPLCNNRTLRQKFSNGKDV